MNNKRIILKKKAYFILFILIFLFINNIQAAKSPEKITVSFSEIFLSDAIKQIQEISKYNFFYDANNTDLSQRVSLKAEQMSIDEAMRTMLSSTNLTFEITNYQIALIVKQQTKEKQIKGTVTDNNGIPITGVNLVVKGTTNGTVSDIDGKFSLNVPENGILTVSYIGFKMYEVGVAGKDIFNITLTEDNQAIDEVVVIGYGTSRKRDIVSAMSTVKGATISATSTSNVQDALQGKVAGLDIQAARYAGDDQQIFIRGARSLNAGNNPLIIVDGIPGSLGSVNTYDIESIEVLKDAASSAIYGSMGANGVILVTTKRGKKDIKREVNFNSYIGLNVPHMMSLQSGEEYTQFRRDGYRYAHGWDTPFTDEDVFTQSELDIIKNGNYTDWQDLLYRNALTQSYHLSISNSGEKTRLLLSFKYDKEEGYY